MARRPIKHVVVLLPGIGGSVLERDGHDVFGFTMDAGLRALLSGGGSVRALELGDDHPDVQDLGDGVRATQVAEVPTLIPRLWKIDGYRRVTDELHRAFELMPGENFYTFPYDWRRDNRVAAHRLKHESQRWLERRRQTHPDARLVLIAHSMGGLVSRYFLEVLGGWKDTHALFTFGTPFRGSLNALDTLANRFTAFGLIDLSQVLRSFTSVYQLLPVFPCLDLGDRVLRRLADLDDVPNLNLDMRKVRAANSFHREIERAVETNAADKAYRERGYRIHPIVGNLQPTKLSARLDGDRVRMLETWDDEEHDGDGTVPTFSAVPFELSDMGREMFAATRHASMQSADHVINQLRGLLAETRQSRFRAAPVKVSLDLEDVYSTGEPVQLRVRLSNPSRAATAVLSRAFPAVEVTRVHLPPADDEWRVLTLPAMDEGGWRVTIEGEQVEPTSDLFWVTRSAA